MVQLWSVIFQESLAEKDVARWEESCSGDALVLRSWFRRAHRKGTVTV